MKFIWYKTKQKLKQTNKQTHNNFTLWQDSPTANILNTCNAICVTLYIVDTKKKKTIAVQIFGKVLVKEGHVLFNDALNTFYLRLYGVRHMVKDHSDSEIGRKEGNVLFNDALNTFYLRLYGVRHMVKGHSDSERGKSLPPHGLLFSICNKGSFICTIPQTG